MYTQTHHISKDHTKTIDFERDKFERFVDESRKELASLYHYHGGIVRKLFLIGGLLMIVGLPFFHNLISQPIYFSIGAALILAIAAGFTLPGRTLSAEINSLVAFIALITFQYHAVLIHSLPGETFFFWYNELLAVNFFFALYFSLKTLRALIVKEL